MQLFFICQYLSDHLIFWALLNTFSILLNFYLEAKFLMLFRRPLTILWYKNDTSKCLYKLKHVILVCCTINSTKWIAFKSDSYQKLPFSFALPLALNILFICKFVFLPANLIYSVRLYVRMSSTFRQKRDFLGCYLI